jgi:hypothetical protein
LESRSAVTAINVQATIAEGPGYLKFARNNDAV